MRKEMEPDRGQLPASVCIQPQNMPHTVAASAALGEFSSLYYTHREMLDVTRTPNHDFVFTWVSYCWSSPTNVIVPFGLTLIHLLRKEAVSQEIKVANINGPSFPLFYCPGWS